jgi:hypothetical protein
MTWLETHKTRSILFSIDIIIDIILNIEASHSGIPPPTSVGKKNTDASFN